MTVLPGSWVAPGVDARDDDDRSLVNSVDRAVWKASEWSPADLTMHAGILEGVSCDRSDQGVEDAQELGSKTYPFVLVPISGFGDFSLGLRAEDEPTAHGKR